MRADGPDDDLGTDFELPFGGWFRYFELGFFAVAFAISIVLCVVSGAGVVAGGSEVVLRALLSALLGLGGAIVSTAGGLNALQLLRDRRPALQVTEEGILNRTYWNATTLVPWDEVVDVRRSRFSWITEIVLTDPGAFRSRQILPIRIMMRVTSLFGIGSLPVYLPQVAASRQEVSRLLHHALDASQLAEIREQRRLEAADSGPG